MITSKLLDNSDEVQLIGLLDILQRLESKERFEQVTNTYTLQDTALSSSALLLYLYFEVKPTTKQNN